MQRRLVYTSSQYVNIWLNNRATYKTLQIYTRVSYWFKPNLCFFTYMETFHIYPQLVILRFLHVQLIWSRLDFLFNCCCCCFFFLAYPRSSSFRWQYCITWYNRDYFVFCSTVFIFFYFLAITCNCFSQVTVFR